MRVLNVFLSGYFAVTVIVWCVMAGSQSCFEWQNAHQLPNMGLRDECIAVWSVSSIGIIVVQLACLAIMAFPPRRVRDAVTPRIRLGVASFAVLVLLTNPWAMILFVIIRGGTLG